MSEPLTSHQNCVGCRPPFKLKYTSMPIDIGKGTHKTMYPFRLGCTNLDLMARGNLRQQSDPDMVVI